MPTLLRRPSPFEPAPTSGSVASPTCCCCCCCCVATASVVTAVGARVVHDTARHNGRSALGPVLLALVGLLSPLPLLFLLSGLGQAALVVSVLVACGAYAAAGRAAGGSPGWFAGLWGILAIVFVVGSAIEITVLFEVLGLLDSSGQSTNAGYTYVVVGLLVGPAILLLWPRRATPPPPGPSAGWDPVSLAPDDAPPRPPSAGPPPDAPDGSSSTTGSTDRGGGSDQRTDPDPATDPGGPNDHDGPTTGTAGPNDHDGPTTGTAGPNDHDGPTTGTAGPNDHDGPTTGTAGPNDDDGPTAG